jgi:hypothetical protein
VSALFRERAADLLQRATASASARAGSAAANLRIELGGLEIGVNVQLHACEVRELSSTGSGATALRLELAWTSLRNPGLFPSMLAELSARPSDVGAAELELRGSYWPPFGPLGAAIDAAVGHRVAEASVGRLMEDLVAQLYRDLPESSDR